MSAQGYNRIRKVQVTPVIEAAAFADGDVLHSGVIQLANILQKDKHSGEVVSAVIVDLAKQSVALSLELFSRSVTGGTINNALDIADSDTPYHLGSIPIAAADYKPFADNSIATVRNVGLAVMSDVAGNEPSRDLYMIVVSRGAPTYVSVADIIVTLFVRQD